VLCLDNDYGEIIDTTTDPHAAWTLLEGSFGLQQSGIQSIVNAELTLAKWDGHKPINKHRDHMKTLRTRLSDAGLTISNMQFYNYFINSLPILASTISWSQSITPLLPTPSTHFVSVSEP